MPGSRLRPPRCWPVALLARLESPAAVQALLDWLRQGHPLRLYESS